MSTLQSIAGKNGCGTANAATGKLGCQIEFGTPVSLFKLPKGFVIPKETELTKAYLLGLVKSGKLTPIVDAASFEDLSAEDTMSTNARGIERLNLLGLPKYKLTFEEGHEFYRQMSKMRGFKNSDFMIGDEFGNLKLAVNSDGDFTGFSAGQVLPEMNKTKAFGGDAESKSLTVQFLNRRQWDEDYTIVTNAQLVFDLIEIQGANPCIIEFFEIPSNSDTTVKFTVKLAADKSTFVEGLTNVADFIIQKGTETLVIAGVVEADNVYTATIPALAAGNVISIQIGDSAANSTIILEGDVAYSSNVATETVIA
jgi:hypothetical protein